MKRYTIAAVLVAFVLGAAGYAYVEGAEKMPALTAYGETLDSVQFDQMEKATFGAGCFWGVESTFRNTEGVVATQVGYTGGHADNPTYKQVCNDATGHAEAVEVIYDPEKVSYDELLNVFWKAHDPTQVDRQGWDVGSQYRSAIFYHTEEQKKTAEASREKLDASGKLKRPIATEIVAADSFWSAEDYHQQYNEKRGVESCNVKI